MSYRRDYRARLKSGYMRFEAREDSPEIIAARIKHRENAAIIEKEISEKFGSANAENARAILDYMAGRFSELEGKS